MQAIGLSLATSMFYVSLAAREKAKKHKLIKIYNQ